MGNATTFAIGILLLGAVVLYEIVRGQMMEKRVEGLQKIWMLAFEETARAMKRASEQNREIFKSMDEAMKRIEELEEKDGDKGCD